VTPFYGTRPDLVAKMMHQMAAFWRTDVIQAAWAHGRFCESFQMPAAHERRRLLRRPASENPKRTGFALSGERKGSRMRVKPTAIWGMSVNWVLTLA
jgi:hypothetical protein